MGGDRFPEIMNLLGSKWTISIIGVVAQNKNKGFNFILRQIKNITPKILSDKLSSLIELGIVNKQVINVEKEIVTQYSLTKHGDDVFLVLNHLKQFFDERSLKMTCANTACSTCQNFNSLSRS